MKCEDVSIESKQYSFVSEFGSIEALKFNNDDVPVEYTWSGYTNDAGVFVDKNFLKIDSADKQIEICEEQI